MFADARILIAGLAMAPFISGGAAEAAQSNVVVCKGIETAAQLQAMQNNLAGVYCLVKNIDASALANFAPIGDQVNRFTGRLYGNNHVIANLSIDSAQKNVGLFGVIDGAVIQDLALVNAKVTATAAITFVGPVVGLAYGSSAPSTIANVSVTGRVKSLYNAGGLAGYVSENIFITRCWSAASVSAGDNSYVGGLIGESYATVEQSFASGPVTTGANGFAGGLIGYEGGVVRRSYAVGRVRAGDGSKAGGLSGDEFGTVQQSYAAGPVIGGASSDVGGLVGNQDGGEIRESYAVGFVSGDAGAALGGLIGLVSGSPVVTDSYWDTQTSGQATSAGGLGVGKPTTPLRARLPTGFGSAWANTKTLSYPFLNDPDIHFTSPLATTVVNNSIVFVFLPISQLDEAQYETPPAHPGQASLAAVYTMIARAIGISDNVAKLKNVKIDRYFWDDATQTTTWKGPVQTFATLGPLKPIGNATPLNGTNVIGRMDQQELVILRGIYTKAGGGTATHFMLGTLYTRSGGKVVAVVANDPRTGRQVSVDPTSKKVVAPANFPLANFKVNGYQPVTLSLPPSDIRLKRDIVKLARRDDGLGLYRYRYLWDDEVYVGVMAQEVAGVVPSAVVRGPDDYLRVDYSQLGLRLQTWNEWLLTEGGGGLPQPPH